MSIRFLWIVAGIFLFPALVESAAIIQKVSGIPPGFEPNRGQAPAPARYLLRGGGVYLTPDSMLVTPIQVGFRFVSASASATETASEQLPGLVNVLRGSSASAWHTGIPRYGRVEFQQIYPGISVAYTIREKQLICQLTLAPGADLSAVKLEALGVQNINGTATSITLWFSRLVTYSLNGLTAYVTGSSERVSVPARFRLNGGNTFQLEMDAPSTESRREIEFTVGSGLDQSPPNDVVAGPSGSIYLAGALGAVGVGGTVGVGGSPDGNALDPALEICSWTMPMPTPCSDAYVAKFNAAGELAWLSYFHGVRSEEIAQVRLDSKENIYVAGGTDSYDFPVTPGALQTSYAGPTPPFSNIGSGSGASGDMFLARLNPADGRPVYSTFLGGPGVEWASILRVDAAGNAYVFGPGEPGTPVTSSAMRATPSCTHCNNDYVAKVDPSGARLIYATYLAAYPMAVDVDAAGSVYFAGAAQAGEIRTTTDAYQTTSAENGDGFVAKLTKDGSALDYATYIGGVDRDYTSDLVVDSQGNAWANVVTIIGVCCGNSRHRLVKLDSRGSRILVESNGGEMPLVVDSHDNLWVAAWPPTTALVPTSDALLSKYCGQGIMAKLTSDWRLLFATYPSDTIQGLDSIYGLDSNGAPLLRTSTGVGILDLSALTPPVVGCVVSSANWSGSYIAPGQLVSLFGKGLGPEQGMAYTLGNDGRLGTSLAGTRVLFDDVAAPLLYAQAEQVNAIVPFGVKTGVLFKVAVEYQGQTVATTSMSADKAVFAFFTLDGSGHGQAAAFNQDGTLNSPTNPARRGSIVSLWGTGAGQTTPASVDGAITGSDPPRIEATAWLWATQATVLYAGAAPGMVAGVTQINIRIPSDYSDTSFPLTAVPVWMTINGTNSTAGATIAVR